MLYLQKDLTNDYSDVVLNKNRLLIADSGIKLGECSLCSVLGIQQQSGASSVKQTYLLNEKISNCKKVVPINAYDTSGNGTFYTTGNRNFIGLIQNCKFKIWNLENIIYAICKYEDNMITHTIDTQFPLIQVNGNYNMIHPGESSCTVKLLDVEDAANLTYDLNTINNLSQSRIGKIKVNIDLDKWISELESKGISIYNVIYPFMQHANIIILPLNKLNYRASSNSYMYESKEIDPYVILPDNELLGFKMSTTKSMANSSVHIRNLIWYKDNSFTEIIEQPNHLTNTKYYVKSIVLFSSGINSSLLSSNSNVTINNIGDNEFEIDATSISNNDNITLTININISGTNYKRFIALPIIV